MKIVLATYGSLGDVQPMLALALALKGAGHDVLLAGPPEKEAWVRGFGIPFRPLGANMTAVIDGMEDAYSWRSAFHFTGYMRGQVEAQFDSLPEILKGADLAVGASLVFALSTVSETMGIPYRFIAFTPQVLPSGHHPFPALKHHGLPRWFNRMTWRVSLMLDRLNLSRMINRKRRSLGLHPVHDVWAHILGTRVIVAADRVIAQVPPDVKILFSQTGYLHMEQPNEVHPDLDAFLAEGPPPLYAGFGSMPRRDQARLAPLVIEAARRAGQRVVLGKFWEGPSHLSPSRGVFFIRGYSHLRLFPGMAAVIHHGGAGTTATAALSGIPQIIVPHVLDQYYWGDRIWRSGLGPRPVWRSRLNIKRLTEAIEEALQREAMRRRAKAASRMINRQESLEAAVREVLKCGR